MNEHLIDTLPSCKDLVFDIHHKIVDHLHRKENYKNPEKLRFTIKLTENDLVCFTREMMQQQRISTVLL